MRRYPEYKESDVEFIGRIPKTWHLIKLKNVAQIDNSGLWGEEQGSMDIDAPVSTTAHLTLEGDWLLEQMPVRSFSKIDYEYYSGENGDIIIVKSSGSITNIITGKAGFIDNRSKGIMFSNFMMRVKPNQEKYEPKLLYYFLTSFITKERIKRMVSGTTYPNLKVEEYISNLIPIPPSKDEQIQIANFLDRKTEQIDELIRIKEKRIELLQEQRTALINQAVTKGLDPNVEMKPSGVEWIGEIPAHWDTIRCTHLFERKHIKNTSGEINLSVYRDYGVIKRDSRDDNYNRISEDTSNYKLVETGDFVFNKMKCWQGSLGISEYRGIVSPAYTVCKPKKLFHGKYFHHLLRSCSYIQEFNRLSYGIRTSQWELRFEDFKEIVVPFPTILEQTQIGNFLDHKIQQIDELIAAEQQNIELLKEYRQSLISEAVTGKIDVRNEA